MERTVIKYKGKEYQTVTLSIPEVGEVTVAECELWEDMAEYYEIGEPLANAIDDTIYFYVDNGMLSDEINEKKLMDYLSKYEDYIKSIGQYDE